MNGSREEKIEAFLKEPVKVGDVLQIKGFGLQDKSMWGSATVTQVIDGVPFVKQYSSDRAVTEEYKKYTGYVGVNPFFKDTRRVQSINFTLESILHILRKEQEYDILGTHIKASNENPFVFVDGVQHHYQRPLVWTLKNKQLLLESIYNGVDCGKIVVRNRSWKELKHLQKDGHFLAWRDIVDGKQRLNAILSFVNGDFADSSGNYYNDLSMQAQKRLTNHQLFSYAEIIEDSSDEEVLLQFLKLNFSGVPQSKEHLNFVKGLHEGVKR
jgi:hypothetical protein